MSKSVFVIDTPKTCVDCIFCQEYGIGSKKYAYCYVTNGDSENDMKPIDCIYGYRNSKPEWCPLKPLPEKMKVTGVYGREYFQSNGKMHSYKIGWNDCVDAITGGEVDGEINT